jgi:hypothetical protein
MRKDTKVNFDCSNIEKWSIYICLPAAAAQPLGLHL